MFQLDFTKSSTYIDVYFIAFMVLCLSQLTSQDKTAQVIQRALEKHHLEHMNWRDFTLTQVISQERGQDRETRLSKELLK